MAARESSLIVLIYDFWSSDSFNTSCTLSTPASRAIDGGPPIIPPPPAPRPPRPFLLSFCASAACEIIATTTTAAIIAHNLPEKRFIFRSFLRPTCTPTEHEAKLPTSLNPRLTGRYRKNPQKI